MIMSDQKRENFEPEWLSDHECSFTTFKSGKSWKETSGSNTFNIRKSCIECCISNTFKSIKSSKGKILFTTFDIRKSRKGEVILLRVLKVVLSVKLVIRIILGRVGKRHQDVIRIILGKVGERHE